MKIIIKLIKLPSLPLILILSIAFILRVTNLNYNSPFLDEAIHIKLGRKVLNREWQEAAPFSWIGGMPLFYPPLSAFAANFGQVLGSRFLNVLLGTLSVYLIYLFSKNLQLSNKTDTNQFIAGISSLFLAILAIPIFLSRLAVYDMLSFTLFLASLALLQKSLLSAKPKLWQRENLFFFSFIFLLASFMAKYTTLIYFPLLIIWAIFQSKKRGRLILKSCLKYFVLPLIFSTIFYFLWNSADMRTFLTNQFSEPQDRSTEIFNEFLKYTTLILPFSLLGILILYLRQQTVSIYFLLGTLTIPLFHILTNNLSAVTQHTFLSLTFLIPSLAFLLTLIREENILLKTIVTLLILIPSYFQSQSQIKDLELSWSNSYQVMTFLKNNLQGNEKILSSEDDITDLALPNIPEDNIIGPWEFDYQGKSGIAAYRQAVIDGYFNFILINDKLTVSSAQAVKESVGEKYQLIYDSPPFKIYKLFS